MSGWRDIKAESPPRDGSWIVVTSTHNRYYRAAIQFDDGLGGWVDTNEASHNAFMNESVTHWQSFPENP